MKRIFILAIPFALVGCQFLESGTLPAGVLNSANCDVAGTASIPGTVNLSFQCSGSLSQQGPPAVANAMRSSAASLTPKDIFGDANLTGSLVSAIQMPAPAPQPWPIPPAPAPLPPLPSH